MKDLSLIKKELAIAKKAIANIEALLSLESNVSVKGEDHNFSGWICEFRK